MKTLSAIWFAFLLLLAGRAAGQKPSTTLNQTSTTSRQIQLGLKLVW
jgi:hypothetical protein